MTQNPRRIQQLDLLASDESDVIQLPVATESLEALHQQIGVGTDALVSQYRDQVARIRDFVEEEILKLARQRIFGNVSLYQPKRGPERIQQEVREICNPRYGYRETSIIHLTTCKIGRRVIECGFTQGNYWEAMNRQNLCAADAESWNELCIFYKKVIKRLDDARSYPIEGITQLLDEVTDRLAAQEARRKEHFARYQENLAQLPEDDFRRAYLVS